MLLNEEPFPLRPLIYLCMKSRKDGDADVSNTNGGYRKPIYRQGQYSFQENRNEMQMQICAVGEAAIRFVNTVFYTCTSQLCPVVYYLKDSSFGAVSVVTEIPSLTARIAMEVRVITS